MVLRSADGHVSGAPSGVCDQSNCTLRGISGRVVLEAGLERLRERVGGAGLSLPVVIKVLMLLGLFAAFFSAVLLAITLVYAFRTLPRAPLVRPVEA